MGSCEGRVGTSDSAPGSAKRQPQGCHIVTFPSGLPYFGERFPLSEDTGLSQSLQCKENPASSPAAVGTARGTAQVPSEAKEGRGSPKVTPHSAAIDVLI